MLINTVRLVNNSEVKPLEEIIPSLFSACSVFAEWFV